MYILYNLCYIIMHMLLYVDLKTQYYLIERAPFVFTINVLYTKTERYICANI